MKKGVLTFLMGLAVLGSTEAAGFEKAGAAIETRAWEVRELSNDLLKDRSVRSEYEEKYSGFVKESRELAREIVAAGEWQEFSEFYKGLDSMGRQNYEMVVKGILEELFRQSDYVEGMKIRAQDYFPGYGYAKPGYTYRKGRETKRDFLYAYWKEEEITESASMVKELTIEISLLAKFQLEFPKLEVLEKLNVNIEGKIYECVKIKVEQSRTIKTRQQRKFGYEKAWFELFEAKKKWFGDLEWQLVGETFQHDNTPTGESVVTSIEG